MNSKLRILVLTAPGVLLAACGGTTDQNGQCPPGYTCVANDAATSDAASGTTGTGTGDGDAGGGANQDCPPGYVCIPEDSGSHAPSDAGADVTLDASVQDGSANGDATTASGDAGNDAPNEGGADAGTADARSDSGLEEDAGGGGDAALDGEADGEVDAATDTGADAADAAFDAGPPPPTPTPPSPAVVLDYEVLDARQSAPLGSIVMISSTPTNSLHIFNEATQIDTVVPLPAAPVVLGLDPSGLHAAVAYDANVSWVDLQAATVRATCPLSSNASGVALSASNVAYVVPATDQWVNLHAVDLGTCTETLGSSQIWAGGAVALHPSGLAAFTTVELDPNSIDRCALDASPITCTDSENYQNWGTYSFGNDLWFSADGERLYSASGVTLRLPSDPNASPATYGGALNGISSVVWMSEATYAQEIAVIPGTADTSIQINETNFLGAIKTLPIPGFPLPAAGADAGSGTAHGHFVFTTPALDMLYVIAQADPSSGALHDYAIESFRP